MNELYKELLSKYQIRRRKYKNDFINFVVKNYKGFRVDEAKYVIANRNLVFGDIKSSKILITAHYDTCAKSPFPIFCFPQVKFFALFLFAAAFIFGVLIGKIESDIVYYYLEYSTIIEFIIIVIFFYLFLYPFIGASNKHNSNDNTSGVFLILDLISKYSNLINNGIAFVLFDNEECGLLGSKAFKRKYKNIINDKLIINIDCISDGNEILIMPNRNAKKIFGTKINNFVLNNINGKNIVLRDSEKSSFDSDHKIFSKSIGIGAFNSINGFLFLSKIHSNKDITFDINNIYLVEKSIISFINSL